MEGVVGLCKTEVIRHRGPWRNLDEVEYVTLAWMDWFNNRRLLEATCYLRSAEYEQQYDETMITSDHGRLTHIKQSSA